MMGILDKNFRYTNAANSSKPNYLRRKFLAIQRELEAKRKAAEEAQAKVSPIAKRKTA